MTIYVITDCSVDADGFLGYRTFITKTEEEAIKKVRELHEEDLSDFIKDYLFNDEDDITSEEIAHYIDDNYKDGNLRFELSLKSTSTIQELVDTRTKFI